MSAKKERRPARNNLTGKRRIRKMILTNIRKTQNSQSITIFIIFHNETLSVFLFSEDKKKYDFLSQKEDGFK